jgi:cold shock CspA family protein
VYDERSNATVEWFNHRTDMGFAYHDDGTAIFLHRRHLINPKDSVHLGPGTRISCFVAAAPKGPKGIEIELLAAEPQFNPFAAVDGGQ